MFSNFQNYKNSSFQFSELEAFKATDVSMNVNFQALKLSDFQASKVLGFQATILPIFPSL